MSALAAVLWFVVRQRAEQMTITESRFIAPGRGD
jgi:hypothetical protein